MMTETTSAGKTTLRKMAYDFEQHSSSHRKFRIKHNKKKKKSDDPEDGVSKIEWAGSPLIYHPEGKNPTPSKYIEAWPPTLGVGYWEGLPLLPSTVKKINLEMNFSLRNTGGSTLPVEFKWEGVEVDPSWQLGEGAEFKHDVTETIQE